MPQVHEFTKHDVVVEWQHIRSRLDSTYERHLVFDCVADFETYFMMEQGIIPELIENWRHSAKGDWVKADDGGVCQVLRRKVHIPHPKDGKKKGKYTYAKNGYVGTIVGTFIANDNIKMDTDFLAHPSRYSFKKIDPATYVPKQRQTRLGNKKRDFIAQVVVLSQSMKFYEMLIVAYQRAFHWKGSPMLAYKKGLELLRNETLVKVLADQIKVAAEKHDVTVDYIIGGIKNIADTARREDVSLNAFVTLGKMIGMDDDDQDPANQLNEGFQGFGKDKQIEDGKPVPEKDEAEEADFTDIESEFGVSLTESPKPEAKTETVTADGDDITAYK